MNGQGSWEHVLQYIYKHKRRHFKIERYRWFFESQKYSEEIKEDESIFSNKEIMRLDTGRANDFKEDTDIFTGNEKARSQQNSPKVAPATHINSESKSFVI